MRFTNKFPYTTINNINLDWIIKRVKELGETVRSYAQDIANAVALAEAAQDAAESVTATAESAVTTAQTAEATANAIAGTANTALSTAQAAETTAQAAEATANAIAGTANTALSTAQAANTTAQAANTTAQAAEESADNAETIAGTASANASNAVQTANTALATADAALVLASQVDSAALNEKAGKLVDTETGAVVSFVPDRTIEQDLQVIVAVEPVQLGSGVPSPDNVRPISGRTSVNIMHSGADTSNPTTYAIQLGQTVYGGTLDAVNGTMTVEWAKQTFDGSSDEDWRPGGWGDGYRYLLNNLSPLCSGVSNDVKFNYLVTLQSISDQRVWGGKIYASDRIDTYWPTTITTVPEFRAYLANNNLEVVYKLATPFEIQFNPVTIAALVGQTNNVWSDAGNVTVEFAADLKWYIDKEIAELQALVLENGG